ncbi:MAG TPA: UDP-3-O-(3-hydroxymyristoyl)glucosamine N-acyltransferase [Ignavibacteria bacterium]|nr:UDP-3-O-(3-hydroxymyristoyl)glucosamine N-acyltransferase [Ignavibacteria bacterium]
MKLTEISKLLNGIIEGKNNVDITGVGKIETAAGDEITFISNPLYEKYFSETKAGAVIVSNDFVRKGDKNDIPIVKVDDPYISFLKLLEIFEKEIEFENSGISDSCFIDTDTVISDDASIGNFVSIGKKCTINSGTRIYPNCTIYNEVVIGNNCKINSNVTIYNGCIIGNNVTIHSGTVIGSDGFGFAKQSDGKYKKIPQTGIVKIEDNVEIGANCCIDRATIGETKICTGVKLDNQIQIAHNVEIGEDTVIAAQVGIAGSTKIGKRCMIGGQSGLVGHITICDDVIIGASVGVSKSIDKPGIYIGYRARPQRESLVTDIGIRNLGKLEKRVKDLEDKSKK